MTVDCSSRRPAETDRSEILRLHALNEVTAFLLRLQDGGTYWRRDFLDSRRLFAAAVPSLPKDSIIRGLKCSLRRRR